MMNKKLGKRPPRIDHRTLCFANYLTSSLPAAPQSTDWRRQVKDWPMFLNDKLGDCTIAGAAHLVNGWTANASGEEAIITDEQVQAAYSAVTGYDPATGANDNGAVELDVLNYWRTAGVGNHRIQAYTALEPQNLDHLKQAINLFGGVYTGFALPSSCEGKTTWSVPIGGPVGKGSPGSLGGHAVPLIDYDQHYFYVVTWGEIYRATYQFIQNYMDESYAILSSDWITKDSKSPSGFDTPTLLADLNYLR
jgi:hypothetical protein